MTPRTVAARSAWVSGGWGLAEYVISSSSWRASPTRSESTAAVARTGTWWEAGPLHTVSTLTSLARWVYPAARPVR